MSRYIDADVLLLDIQQGIKFGQLTVCEMISKQPTAEVKPIIHGTWIENNDEYRNYFECSVCHMEFHILNGTANNYCPNCGAEMEQDDGNKTL